MQFKYVILISIISLGLGLAIGYFAMPTKVIVKTKIQEVTVTNTDVQQKEKKNVVTKVTETVDPKTGQKIVTTEIIDKSETITESQTKTDTNIVTDTESVKEYSKQTLLVSVMAGSNVLQKVSLDNHIDIGVHVQKRLLGPIYLGAFGFSNKYIGISIGLTF